MQVEIVGDIGILQAIAARYDDVQLIGNKLVATGLTPRGVRSIRNLVKDTNRAFDSNLRVVVTS